MPRPMYHSELTHRLLELQRLATATPTADDMVVALIRDSSRGVVPEGGSMDVFGIPDREVAIPPLYVSATDRAGTASKVSDEVNKLLIHNSGFKFGAGSMKELVGVESKLVQVVILALRYSTQDFVVYDGIRTFKEQKRHIANGTSRTMQSKHLEGLAVDLVPYIGGRPVWDWDGCYRIAIAMDRAATELKCADRIVWGGAWDRSLADFGGHAESYEQEVQAYRKRHAGSDFIDGPHFEWRK